MTCTKSPRSSLPKKIVFTACFIAVQFSGFSLWAADRIKADNTTNLNTAGSWTGGVPDLSNMAVWNNAVTGANSAVLGGNVAWQGIRIANPGGPVTIGAGSTLTLSAGAAGTSIDMSAATQNLTIQSGLTLRAAVVQFWNIAAGRTLTLNTGLFTRGAGATLNVQGGGVVNTTNIFNDATGIIGAWATIGSGVDVRYAMVDGSSNIAAYTGGTPAATAADVTSTTGQVHYDVAAVGTLGAGASVNTLRYTGAAGTITGSLTANGILTAGTGALTMSGNITIGASRELVIFNGDSNAARSLTLSGSIGEGRVGSGVTKGGLGLLTLSGGNTYTGVTIISRGKLSVAHNDALGSTAGGTRVGLSGTLSLAGNITSAEPIWLDDITNAISGYLMLENNGTNTLTGAIRISSSTRWQGSGTVNVTGGISTTAGNSGSSFVVQAGTTMNVTGKPLSLGGSGGLYMDNGGRTIVLGVQGSTYGSHSLYGGTLRAGAANVFSRTAPINFSVSYAATASTLDLNGFDQAVAAIATGTYSVHGAYDRVITSATAATLTTGLNNGSTTFDGRMTGAVALTKVGTGTLILTGPSTTTGGLTVNGGTVNLNFVRATASQTGAGTVSNYLSSAAPLTLGGGTFQLTGRNNGTATSLTGASWASGAPTITVASTAQLAPGQLVTHPDFPAGAYVASVLNTTQFILSAAPTAAGSGATINATPNSTSTAQTFAGLILNPGASGVTVALTPNGSDGTVLHLGAITVNPGATVNFTLPAGGQSATHGITTDTTNTHGILGGWARVGNNWAVNSTNAAAGNIMPLAIYSDVNRLGATLAGSASANVRIINGGTSGSLTPATAGTTNIHTLLQSANGGTVTYDPGANDILRLGAAGGIMVASDGSALTLGASANDGLLTAGGADNTAGTLYLTNNHASNLLTINSTIADNGSGAVGVTTSGAGITLLAGANTHTGRTIVGGGSLRISNEQNLGAGPASPAADQLTLAGGTLNTTATFSIDDANRGITLAPAGGNISVNGSTTLTVANVISGPGNLTVSGSGTLALAAANTFSGTTFSNAGTLALGHVDALQNSTLAAAAAGTISFTAAGTNTYNLGGLAGDDGLNFGANSLRVGSNDETTVFSGSLTGSGNLIKTGAGTLNLTTANSGLTGDTRIEGGMIVLAHVNALQNSTLDTGPAGTQSANLTLGEGTLYNLGGLKGSADFDLAVANLSVGANGQSTVFSGVLKGAFNNNVTKVGAGTLSLLGNNTYIGATMVSAGRLVLGGTNLSTITVAPGGNLGGEGSTAGDITFAGATHTLEVDAGTAAALGATGAGSLNVSALNAGGFTINVSGSAVGAFKVLTYGSGGFVGDAGKFTLGTATASARGAGSFADNGVDAITLDLGYVVNTWVGGGANPTFWDIGTTANWANAKDNVFQNGDAVVFADGALNYNPTLQSDVTVDAVTFSNTTGNNYTLDAVAGQTVTSANGVALTGSGNVTINVVIAGGGSLTQSGGGITTLGRANTYTGGTFITGGTLRIGDEAALGTAPAASAAGHLTLNGAGATLFATASLSINDSTRGITLGAAGGGFGADTGVALALGNAITGGGAFIKSGAGTVSLAAANTYTGLTTINEGTLELNNSTGGGNAIAGDGVAGTEDLRVNAGATLRNLQADQIEDGAILMLNGGTWNLNGKNETIRRLTGTSVTATTTTFPTLTLGGATLTLNRLDWDHNPGTAASRSFSGTGTLRFVADGSTQAVFETNHQGTFTSSLAVQIDALSLTFRASTYGTEITGKVSGTGKLIYDPAGGAGGLTLTNGANDYSGGTQWSSSSGVNGAWNLFTVRASGALGSGDVTLQGGNQNTWISGSNTPSAFIFSGGTTTHANHFNLTGSATISAGGSSGAAATADRTTLSGDFDVGAHTLFVRGTGTGTISGVISGTGGITKIDNHGTWVLAGANTYSGATNVSAGLFQVGQGGAGQTGTGNVTVQSGATLFGTGVVRGGSFTAVSGSSLHAGDSTAASSFGTLNFTPATGGGTHSLEGGVFLGIGTANNQGGIDPTFGGNAVGTAGYFAFVNDPSRSLGTGAGSHDLLSFNAAADTTGYGLTVTGSLQVAGSGFNAQAGQVFNLLDWSSVVTADFAGFNVGDNYRDGSADDAGQLNLPTLGAGLFWDVSQFTTSGVIVVVPEPGRALLLLLGVVGLLVRRRRPSARVCCQTRGLA